MAEAGTVLSDLRALLESGEGADVTLVVGDSELSAHSQILSARSPVFAAMLRSDMLEARSRRIEVADVGEDVLQQVLWFMYTDTAPQLASMAAELLAAADKYNLPRLKEKCEQQLAQGVSVENAAATAALAVLYRCPGLRDAAVQFIAGHPEVLATEGWLQVMRENVEAAAEICKELAAVLPHPGPTKASGARPNTAAHHRVRQVPAAIAPPTPPPDEATVSFLRTLTEEERGRWLIKAAEQRNVVELRALLAAGVNLGTRDACGETALHLVAEGEDVQAASCLLEAGAEVDARGSWQRTPLHRAAANGHAAVVRLLLAASADPNARDDTGRTPLHGAAANGHAAVVRLLLAASADPNARDNTGRTPLHSAANWGKIEAATALLAAAALLEAGAYRGARDEKLKRPLDIAREQKNQQLIDILS